MRRRRHHAALARALEVRGVSPAIIAAHWNEAQEPGRARPLLVAAEAACKVHAYRDAKNAIDQALALWPEGEDGEGRLLVVDRLAECAERCGEIADAVSAWQEEERHYSVAAVRWAASLFGRHGFEQRPGSCTDALARIAAATGTAAATGALPHALGEYALFEDDARHAADQFERTLELLGAVAVPPETAETQVRAGVALAASGDRDKAVERLVGAYHTARTLGARPLAAIALGELETLGVDVQRRLGGATA